MSILIVIHFCAGVVGAIPLPDYPLAAPVQKSIAQDALILQATQRWYSIPKLSGPSERLRVLLRTRPIIQYDRIDGSLFVEVLVSWQGRAIVADSFASELCTSIGPPKYYEKNTFWNDRPMWAFQLEITAKWAGKWKPMTSKVMLKGVDKLYALPWTEWVSRRITKASPALATREPKKRKPSEGKWGYEDLNRGDSSGAIMKATIVGHQQQILNMGTHAGQLDYAWKYRKYGLSHRLYQSRLLYESLGCLAVEKSLHNKINGPTAVQVETCQKAAIEVNEVRDALAEHYRKRKPLYIRIRKMRQAVEFHKRGLAEAKRVLNETTEEVKTK